MSPKLSVLLLVTLACLARSGSAQTLDVEAALKKVQSDLEELKAEKQGEAPLTAAPHVGQSLVCF